MKTKTLKIFALAVALCALIAGVVGISAFADDEPTLDIISKNMSYGSNFKLAFAVDNTGVPADAQLEVLLYAEDPAVKPDTTVYKATLSQNTKYEDTYPVYFSYGIPAKDLTAYVWAQAHIVGTETYGEVYRYSAVEYFYERLYTETDDVTEAQAKLYNTVLQYCADAQDVLATDSPAIGDVNYVYVSGGTLDGVNYSALLADEATFAPEYSGTTADGVRVAWDITSVAADGTESVDRVFAGDDVTVSADVMICEPELIEGPVYAGVAGTGEYYNNATGTKFNCNAIAKGTSYSDYDSRSGASYASVYNNEYVQLNKGTSTGRPYFQYNNNTAKPTDAENLVMIVEGDFAFGGCSIADGNNPINPYIFAFHFNGLYCALYMDVSNEGKVTLVNSHTIVDGGFELETDTWYNLRFEIHDLTENGFANESGLTKESAVIKIFVNGECFADVYAMDADSSSSSNRMNAMIQDVNTGVNTGAYICLDNVFLGYDDKAYTPYLPAGVSPISGTHNGGEYYNGEYEGERDDGTENPTIAEGIEGDSIADPDGFVYVYRTGEKDHAYNSPVRLTYPTDGSTPATVIELDYAMGDNAKASYSTIIKYRYGSKQVGFYFGVSNGQVVLHNSVVAGEKVSFDLDTWCNLRFEIYGTETIKVYVNGVWTCDVKGLDIANNSSTNNLTLTLQGNNGAVYGYHAYDNVYIGFTEATYVAGNPEG